MSRIETHLNRYPLAIFPLGSVVFPSQEIRLRIFEQRYRDLVRDLQSATIDCFATVAIKNGSEVGGLDERYEVATVIKIEELQVAEDGQAALVGRGVRRVVIDRWLDANVLYPTAEVFDLIDKEAPGQGASAQVDSFARQLHALLALFVELGGSHHFRDRAHDADPTDVLWRLCEELPAPLSAKLGLLSAVSFDERLAMAKNLVDLASLRAEAVLKREGSVLD